MSEFSKNNIVRIDKLTKYVSGLIDGKNGRDLIEEYQILSTSFIPDDILPVFDNLFDKGYDIEEIKSASTKLFNILYTNFSELANYNYPTNSIISLLIEDNEGLRKYLNSTRETIKKINKEVRSEYIESLFIDFTKLEGFTNHYTVMQNIVFPEIEKQWDQHQCLKILWSFHDDIVQNIKRTIEVLRDKSFDLKLFNSYSSKVYFNINTIINREEQVLFPVLYNSFDENIFNVMNQQLTEIPLSFADSSSVKINNDNTELKDDYTIKMSTGELSLSQLELVFNHLPVDITFVDENDEVRYFSTPKHRIFPRTVGIIGRNVQQCHPHESVHAVIKIIQAFRNGKKDVASFWINMGEKFVLIQYFAVRDKDSLYKGVLEVSQEISDIKKIEGERRLLDW